MSLVLIPLLILLVACTAAVFSGLIDRRTLVENINRCKRKALTCLSLLTGLAQGIKSKGPVGQLKQSGSSADFISGTSCDTQPDQRLDLYAPCDMDVLNCRVLISELKDGDNVYGAFGVEICGSIHAPDDMRNATLRITIHDVTGGASAEPVLAASRQVTVPSGPDTREFSYMAELGRLPREVTKLDDWTAVARLRSDGLLFPRRGRRMLQFNASILSADGGRELAEANCKFVYDNPMPGYLDLQENSERTKVLTVALAFAVSAADGKLYDCEIELIKRWAWENVLDNKESGSDQSCAKLEKALSNTVAFFIEGNKLDTFKLCEEIADIAPVRQRYELLDLCLRVATAKGSVTAEEMAMLKQLASGLEVDATRFRTMMEKILSLEMREVMDINDLLGITADMSREGTRRHLNHEYRKWNSRVTSANPQIQSQADQMLRLISEARGQYIVEDSAFKVAAARR